MSTEQAPAWPATRHWQAETDDNGIAWLCLDKADSGTNVLSAEVLEDLEALVAALAANPPMGVVIWSAKRGNFIAGADIHEFPALAEAGEQRAVELTRRVHKLLGQLEGLPVSSVAVINGHTLGGGLELAMACTRRIAVATDSKIIGLPEVKLGVHPGFGGTVRAVRLAGTRQGMSLMLTGRSLRPAQARDIGIVDAVVDEDDWRDVARALAQEAPPRRAVPLLDRLMALAPLRPLVARQLRAQVARRARREHYPAPFAMVDLWRRHGGADTPAAYDAEARSFGKLVVTPTSRNLVRVFFLQESLKRAGKDFRGEFRHVHVVGAGVMGGDIAAWCAMRGLSVTLQDRESQYVNAALERAAKLFEKRLKTPERIDAARARLVADVTGEGVPAADVVIEAIFEDLEAKRALFESLEPRMKRDAILGTNTSSIPLEDLAGSLRYADRLIGLHFFNPVASLPLVEVVHTPTSSERAQQAGLAFARQIDKLPLPCRSHPGFLVNRILAPYMAEAMELAREGVPPAVIDKAAEDFGMPMGPVELADSVGLDVALHVSEILAPVVGREPAPELAERVAAGDVGRKSGRGFYEYRDGKPVKPRSPGEAAPEVGERLVLALLNEAAACLEDNIVAEPDLVDAGVIFGTGFAPFRGGPLQYARSRGIGEVTAALAALEKRHGPRFRPSPGWARLKE